ncbi:MAG: diguanylate cyclase [Planctomycetota bacterium]
MMQPLGDPVIPGQRDHSADVGLLLVEADERMARDICAAIEAGATLSIPAGETASSHATRSATEPVRFAIQHVVPSITSLQNAVLDNVDMVICSMALPDGSGLDALAVLRRMRRELPVVLTGLPCDAPLAVEAIRSGARDFVVINSNTIMSLPMVLEKSLAHHRIRQENERLHTDLSRSLSELAIKNQQLQMMITQLESMARTDELTGMSNRRWLNLMLEGHWADATRHDLPLAFVMMDLDGFKILNDQMGHQVGDDILRLAGRMIAANCRDVDIAARYGGDEFCLLMPHTSIDDAILVSQRVHNAFMLAAAARPQDEPRVAMSAGVAHIDLSRPVNVAEFVRHADEALYAAKAAGKQQIMIRHETGLVPCPPFGLRDSA